MYTNFSYFSCAVALHELWRKDLGQFSDADSHPMKNVKPTVPQQWWHHFDSVYVVTNWVEISKKCQHTLLYGIQKVSVVTWLQVVFVRYCHKTLRKWKTLIFTKIVNISFVLYSRGHTCWTGCRTSLNFLCLKIPISLLLVIISISVEYLQKWN